MNSKLFRRWIYIILVSVFLSMNGKCCALSEDQEKYERQTVFLLSEYDENRNEGKPVTLTLEGISTTENQFSYQWYECSDHDGRNAKEIAGAVEATYVTRPFSQKEIRYYFCKVEQHTQVSAIDLPIFIVAYTGLPILSINTSGGDVIWNQDEWVQSDLMLTPGETEGEYLNTGVHVKGRGNSSWTLTPKCSYTVRFDKSIRLFDLAAGKYYVLIPNYTDKTLLRNWWAGYLCQNYFYEKDWNPKYVQIEFILNGIYMGNYSIAEQIRIGPERINIPTIKQIYKKTNSIEGLKYGGYVLEIDQHEMPETEFVSFITKKGLRFCVKRPNLEDLPEKDRKLIIEYIREKVQKIENDICENSDGVEDIDIQLWESLDRTSVINWYLLKEFSKDADANFYSSVFFFYNPVDGHLHMGPQWDFDIAFGNNGKGEEDPPEGRILKNAWFDALNKSVDFTDGVRKRWKELRDQLIEKAIPVLEKKAEEICVSAEMNFERWRILGRYVWNSTFGADQRKTYMSEVEYMVDWTVRRIKWIDRMADML